jgi:hypothetical protein
MHRRSHRLLAALTLLAACHKPAAPPPPQVTCAQTTQCSRACPTTTLESCVAACTARIGAAARPYWETLQACSKSNCATQCADPTAMGCKLCVMSNCAAAATACLAN